MRFNKSQCTQGATYILKAKNKPLQINAEQLLIQKKFKNSSIKWSTNIPYVQNPQWVKNRKIWRWKKLATNNTTYNWYKTLVLLSKRTYKSTCNSSIAL